LVRRFGEKEASVIEPKQLASYYLHMVKNIKSMKKIKRLCKGGGTFAGEAILRTQRAIPHHGGTSFPERNKEEKNMSENI